MTTDSILDRRRSSRFAKSIPVLIDNNDEYFSTDNISLTGTFIRTNKTLLLNTHVFLKLFLPGHNIPLKTYGKVAWIQPRNDDSTIQYGVGIDFLSLPRFDFKRLNRFITEYFEKTGKKEIEINSDNHTLLDFSSVTKDPLVKRSKYLYSYINDMKHKGYYTYRRPLLSPCSNRVVIRDDFTGKEREMIMMGSNSYLGLSSHPRVIEAVREATEKYGVGAASAPLLAGTFELHKTLEKRIAELKSCEDAIVFPSGYATNIGVISTLLGKNDFTLLDRLCHASIIDGANMSKATARTFKHSDVNHLEDMLRVNKDKFPPPLIMIEGIYSMDGDIAPLPQIHELARRYNARIMIDDAHATGVIGKKGRGTTSHFGMDGKVDIVMGTMSKAVGQLGGFIASDKEMINYLRHFSRSYFFSTSLPPVVIASCLASLDVLESEPELMQKLWKNIEYFKDNVTDLGFELAPKTESAIVPIIVGQERILKKMSRRIHEEGVYINPVPYPAVPIDRTRFRATIMATHTKEDLDHTLNVLEKVGREFGIIGKARASSDSNH